VAAPIRFAASAAVLLCGSLWADDKAAVVDFQREIRPILSDNCFLCHGPDSSTRMVDLRLDLREGAFAQRRNGTPIVPQKPAESLVYRKITAADPAVRMPPPYSHKTLTDQQKDTIKRWIEQGANWKEHWAFAAPARPAPPAVRDEQWVRNPIDRFILAKVEAAGLRPASEADRRTLIRRLSLDLRGLPPSPEEVAAFVNDSSADAFEKLADRLLATPQFGEHRAHYWLDAARYGDTNGMHYDNRRDMWPYRDWVIQAFNRNLPYDRFVVEQLAGDLLPRRTLDQQIASGFNRNNVSTNENGVIEEEVAAMYVKDRVDTTGTVFLGLTVGCATCHDHKFDPISQRDYYSLAAFFRNTNQMVMDDNRPDAPPMIFVPQERDRARWVELNAEREALKSRMAEARRAPSAAFDRWLGSKERKQLRLPPDGPQETWALPIDQAPLVSGVTRGESPWAGRPALRFDGKSALTLPNLASVTGDEPFSITAWVHLTKVVRHPGLTGSRDAPTIASQLVKVQPPPKPDDDGPGPLQLRGWIIDLDEGVPALRLYGDEGRALRAIGLQNAPLKEGVWTHLTFTYDGSREEKGLSLYVDGTAVPIQRGAYGGQNNTVVTELQGTARNDAPLLIGNDGANGFLNGSIAALQVFDRVLTEEEALEVSAWPALAGSIGKDAKRLSASEREALHQYYLTRHDPAYRKLAKAFDEVTSERRSIQNRAATALVMEERPDSKPMANILYRGMYDQPREAVDPNVPAVLPPLPASYPRNRLGLAQWLVDPSHPLTARVAVNRFWQEIFGTGIVKTSEDFGSQGEAPSHPELLDWLAVDFRESGWDVKRLLRLMVTSAAYRQAALTTEEKLQKDPDDRLLARGPRFRMDGEMVRDYALAASGLLVPLIGGPSVKPYQPAGIWEVTSMMASNTRIYKRDAGPDLYRRSLYTFWKRSAPPAALEIFGAPTRETCLLRRERTNTPLQALLTMDDPQFVEAARRLAEGTLLAAGATLDQRLDFMTARVLARPLDPKERPIVAASYKDFLNYYDSHPADAGKLLAVGEWKADPALPPAEFAALTMLANQLLNLDEALNK
jgi:hypothetical protein